MPQSDHLEVLTGGVVGSDDIFGHAHSDGVALDAVDYALAARAYAALGWTWCVVGVPGVGDIRASVDHLVASLHADDDTCCTRSGGIQAVKHDDGAVTIAFDGKLAAKMRELEASNARI
jgi:hypothetical protein